jgi:hypothetical protein
MRWDFRLEETMTERVHAWSNTFYAGSFFGVFFGLFISLINGWMPPRSGGDVVAIVTAMLTSGILFGVLRNLLMRLPFVPADGDIPLMAGETFEYSSPANHFLNLEGRGGRLALTKTHLMFMPHVANLQKRGVRIARAEIAGAAAVKTLGLIPNGLAVTLKSGRIERFVVDDRDAWVARIGAR